VLCDLLDAEDVARVIASAVGTEVRGGEKVWISNVDLVIPVSTGSYGGVVV
jgi:nitrogen regulatory protein PII